MKTNYLQLFLMLLLVCPMAFSQQIVLFDFGPLAEVPDGSLNYNTTEVALDGVDAVPIMNLINSTGAGTGFDYVIIDRFTFRNTSGTQTPSGDAAAAFDSQATRDSFFGNEGDFNGDVEPTGAFTLSGLDNAKFYSFEVFASRNGVSDNREAMYTITGSNTASGTLDAANNDANTVMINNVQPSGGVITFTATFGPNNTNSLKFYYMGAIRMTESDTVLGIEDEILAANGLKVYPNPVNDVLNIDYILNSNSISSVLIYDINGRLVYNAKNGKNQAGTYSFKWNRLNNDGSKCAPGTYFLKFRTETGSFSKKLILE